MPEIFPYNPAQVPAFEDSFRPFTKKELDKIARSIRSLKENVEQNITNSIAADTDDLSEGTTNLYHTAARVNTLIDTAFSVKDTDDLSEGSTNLYYTQARFDGAFTAKDTDDLSEGATNLYWTQARFDTALAASDTDDIAEGPTNLYFTDTRVYDKLKLVLTAGTNVTLTPNDGLETITIDATGGSTINDTDDVPEGATNLYYTQARFDTAFTAKDTDDLSEGSTNFYYTETRFDTSLGAKDTDDLAEGTSNLYWTQGRFDTAISDYREPLTADRTYFVANAGSDTLNDGLTVGNPFATIAKAIEVVQGLDLGIYNVTIQLANETRTETVLINAPFTGAGAVTIQGDITDNTLAVWNSNSSTPPLTIKGAVPIGLTLNALTLKSSGNGASIQGGSIFTVGAQGLNLGACSFSGLFIQSNAIVQTLTRPINFTGNMNRGIYTSAGGVLDAIGSTFNFVGTPSFNFDVMRADINSTINLALTTMSGAATGRRFQATTGGVISAPGKGINHIPGTSAGITPGTGEYVP